MSIVKKYGKLWDTRCVNKKCSESKKSEELSTKDSTNTTIVLDLDETLVHTFENQKAVDEFIKKNYPKIHEHITNCIAKTAKSPRKHSDEFSKRAYDPFHANKHDSKVNPKAKISDTIYFEHVPQICHQLETGNELSLINRLFKFELGNKTHWAIKRPHLDSFLDYLFEHFDRVILWSAGNKEYVHAVADAIFIKQKPYKIYTRDDCEEKNGSDSHKPLSKISGNDKYLKNIFLVDNLPENSTSNQQNHFYIPDYDPENPKLTKYNLEHIDTALFKIQDFMKQYIFSNGTEDVKKVVPMSKMLYKTKNHLFDSI